MAMQRSRHIWKIYRMSNLEGMVASRNKEQQGVKDGVTSSRVRQTLVDSFCHSLYQIGKIVVALKNGLEGKETI